jgi:single-strand DNA-binding protein
MRALNKVQLIGNLGADPETRYTAAGDAVASANLATSESWTDRQTGELQGRTEWHRLVFFRQVAGIVGQYARKGSRIYVEGKLQTRKWTDGEGRDRYTTEVVVNDLILLDGHREGQSEAPPQRTQAPSAPRTDQRGPRPAPRPQPSAAADDFDDDIPFAPVLKRNEYLV